MSLRLVYDEMNLSLDLPGTSEVAETLGVQIKRCLASGETSKFAWRLVDEITNVLDLDLLPPSPLEVTIATLTAKALNISVPEEVLRYRGRMLDFLDRHQPLLGTQPRNASKQHG